MTTPLRPCGRRECRLCNPRPIHEEPRHETLAEVLLAGAAVVVLAFVLIWILPVLAP